MENISENFSEVLSGTKDRAAIVSDIVNFIDNEKGFISIDRIIEASSESSSSFVKKAVNLLLKNDFLISQDNSHVLKVKLSGLNPEQYIQETFSEASEIPAEVTEHFQQYGFTELVSSVSKQINHENVIVKEFDFDRLMLGRYIDFLVKAKEYISWFKADQATAKKKMKDIKKSKSD